MDKEKLVPTPTPILCQVRDSSREQLGEFGICSLENAGCLTHPSSVKGELLAECPAWWQRGRTTKGNNQSFHSLGGAKMFIGFLLGSYKSHGRKLTGVLLGENFLGKIMSIWIVLYKPYSHTLLPHLIPIMILISKMRKLRFREVTCVWDQAH